MTLPTTHSILTGWDPTPGIVSVWADRDGTALVWRRTAAGVVCERVRFRPWLYAQHLADLPLVQPRGDGPIAVHDLAGETGGYRYLITARSGRALEQAILSGAQRRLGAAVASLHELPEYYRLGPVEQYLIASGRVYFRGLDYDDLHRMQIDLETTGLDASAARIFMVAVSDTRGLNLTLDAPQPEDEAGLIAALCALVRERDPDVIENHNLFGFDLPFLETRAEALGVPLRFGRREGPTRLERYEDPNRWRSARKRMRYSVAGRELVDTLDAVRRHDFVARDLPSHGLKDVARSFGVAGPERTYIPGAEVYATYLRDPERVRRYALDDVAEVAALSRRLMGAPFALASMAPRRYERVGSAGPAMGILEPILVRAYYRANAPLPPPDNADGLDGHAGGALHLFATGVAERVVKADVASLYPSLMRTYRIGPLADTQGALLALVDELLAQRLAHKQAARSAAPGSLEHGRHNALQAAMKLILNSAYGYMGAGSMALFADRRAADEVTRRGRELLEHVEHQLAAQGVTLIEGDTDGVFFAVPPEWGEAEERAAVAAVAATLPPGIALEFEGRYAAMLSHEVKNYALLTYDGRLIMRGVALRSVRAEPFGEQFLTEALRLTLTGDIVGLHALYQATAAGLRERTIPVGAVAARHRLSKTPAEYARSRGSHREAVYEALLAAGREQWNIGERVRCYKTASGGYALVPDPEAATAAQLLPDYDSEHYLGVLLQSYAGRLKKVFSPHDFDQIFRTGGQIGLFDQPIAAIVPLLVS